MINCPFIKDTLYLAKPNYDCLSSYKGAYSNEQSLNFVIPIIVILFLGVIYIMTQRADSGFVSFFLIGAAALTMFYWVRVLKKMTKDQKPLYTQSREQEQKNWVYDLIKGQILVPNDPSKPGALRGIEMKHGQYSIYAIHVREGFPRAWFIKDNSQLDQDGLPLVVGQYDTLTKALNRVF